MSAPSPPHSPRRRALVTGGSGAIGSAICRRLVEAGCHVCVHAQRPRPAVDALVEQLRGIASRNAAGADLVCFDVTDAAASQTALERLLQDGPVQVLVNNAGIHDDAAFPAMRPAQWQHVIDVSLQGFFHVTRTLLLPMLRTRWGRIINISSVAALTGNRGQVNYAAAKGALNSATRALALEVATRGVTVNAVAPGIIATGMGGHTFEPSDIERLVPMGRAGRSEEVAALVGYLASDAAAYITGQVVSINGGMHF